MNGARSLLYIIQKQLVLSFMPCSFVVTCQPCGGTISVDDGRKLFLVMTYLFNYTGSSARIQAPFIANGVKM